MKRIQLFIIVLLVLLCGVAVAEEKSIIASGYCGASGSNVSWSLDSAGKLTISGKGEMEDYGDSDAPWYSNLESIKTVAIGTGVTSIGDGAFYECSSLSSVTIPAGVTRIGESAFCFCGNLSSVTIPESVTSIGDSAFGGCSSLRSVTIPASVTSIGNSAFSYCESLTRVTIPEGVTRIGSLAFEYCTGLTSIVIPKSVEIIGGYAFTHCESLTSIVIPEGVKNIGAFAFYSCLSLRRVTLSASLEHIGQYAFEECAENLTITAPTGSYASEWIEESGLLGDLDELTRNGIVYSLLSNRAIVVGFDYDNEPTTAVIPSQISGLPVTKIADEAFYECFSLTSIVIPESVTSIGDFAFAWCGNLRSIVMPKRLTYLGEAAFEFCEDLTSITIPEGVTSIGDYTFCNCEGLTSITIPAAVTSIGESAFEDCFDLEEIVFQGRNAVSIADMAIPDYIPIRCYRGSGVDLWATANDYTVRYIAEHTHTVVVDPAVPATHVTTGLTEGSHCSVCGEVLVAQEITPVAAVKKLTLPAKLKTIESEAFAGDRMVCVVLPNGCTKIGANAFKSCTQLRFVEIPASVTSISSTAFTGCSNLIIVTSSGSEAQRFAQANGITCVTLN